MITVRDNNLYANGYIIDFGDGDSILEREPLVIEAQNDDKYHTVKTEDRIDVLAWRNYKNAVADAGKYYWVIADANNIDHPLDLEDLIGTDILIPDILRVRLLL